MQAVGQDSAWGRDEEKVIIEVLSPGKRRNSPQKWLVTIFCLLPAICLFFIFVLIPIIQVTYTSLYEWSGLGPLQDFIGLKNYLVLFRDSVMGFFWRILLPLSRPALAVVAILTAVTSWNNFLLPLLILNTQSNWTLPLGTTQFVGQFGSDWASILAFLTLSMLPAVIAYLVAERQIVAGLTAGAVKG